MHDIPEDELNRLLCMVIDVENLFMCVHKEEDADTKQVYFYLFKLLRKGILQMSNVTVEGPLGTPPFEKPSIGKVCLFFDLLISSNLSKIIDITIYWYEQCMCM